MISTSAEPSPSARKGKDAMSPESAFAPIDPKRRSFRAAKIREPGSSSARLAADASDSSSVSSNETRPLSRNEELSIDQEVSAQTDSALVSTMKRKRPLDDDNDLDDDQFLLDEHETDTQKPRSKRRLTQKDALELFELLHDEYQHQQHREQNTRKRFGTRHTATSSSSSSSSTTESPARRRRVFARRPGQADRKRRLDDLLDDDNQHDFMRGDVDEVTTVSRTPDVSKFPRVDAMVSNGMLADSAEDDEADSMLLKQPGKQRRLMRPREEEDTRKYKLYLHVAEPFRALVPRVGTDGMSVYTNGAANVLMRAMRYHVNVKLDSGELAAHDQWHYEQFLMNRLQANLGISIHDFHKYQPTFRGTLGFNAATMDQEDVHDSPRIVELDDDDELLQQVSESELVNGGPPDDDIDEVDPSEIYEVRRTSPYVEEIEHSDDDRDDGMEIE